MLYHDLLEQDLAAWYELSTNGHSLAVTLPLEVKTHLDKLTGQLSLAIDLSRQLKLPFVDSASERWGFSGALTNRGGPDGSVEVVCRLPVLTEWPLGYDNWPGLVASASLAVLFLALELFDRQLNLERKQLLLIREVRSELGPYGSALMVDVSPTLRNWARQANASDAQAISKAMQEADHYLHPQEKSALARFPVKLDEGFIHLDCPGNSCGLDPDLDFWNSKEDKGYTLVPHNTDSPAQQLTLLMGIAKLHELARAAERRTNGTLPAPL